MRSSPARLKRGDAVGPSWLSGNQPLQREERDIVTRAAVEREIGEYFANHAAELEAMAGETCGDGDTRIVLQSIDDEVLVARVGEQTRFHRHRRPVGIGEVAADALAQHLL